MALGNFFKAIKCWGYVRQFSVSIFQKYFFNTSRFRQIYQNFFTPKILWNISVSSYVHFVLFFWMNKIFLDLKYVLLKPIDQHK